MCEIPLRCVMAYVHRVSSAVRPAHINYTNHDMICYTYVNTGVSDFRYLKRRLKMCACICSVTKSWNDVQLTCIVRLCVDVICVSV